MSRPSWRSGAPARRSNAPPARRDPSARGLTGIDGHDLAGDAPRHVAGEKQRGVDDVLGRHEALERHALDHRLPLSLHGDSLHLRLTGDDPIDAIAIHRAGSDTVDA